MDRRRPTPPRWLPPLATALAASVLSLSAAAYEIRPIPVQAEGLIDNTFVFCGASYLAARTRAGKMVLDIDCGGPRQIHCQVNPGGFRYTSGHLLFDCKTPPTTGAFRAMLLPQVSQVTSTAHLQIQVYNSGTTAMTNLVATLAQAPVCSATRASLAPGAVWSYPCTIQGIDQDLDLALRVTGSTPQGMRDATASAQVFTGTGRLGIRVLPEVQRVYTPGGEAHWTAYVFNHGAQPLTNVMAADDQPLSNCILGPLGALPAQTMARYECVRPAVTAGFTAVHTASASDGVVTRTVHAQVLVLHSDPIFASGFEPPPLFANGFESAP